MLFSPYIGTRATTVRFDHPLANDSIAVFRKDSGSVYSLDKKGRTKTVGFIWVYLDITRSHPDTWDIDSI